MIRLAFVPEKLRVEPADAQARLLPVVMMGQIPLATGATEEEAETARLAFTRVLLPRFTADEAIAIVKAEVYPLAATLDAEKRTAFIAGMRMTLESLATASVFVDEIGSLFPDLVRERMAAKINDHGLVASDEECPRCNGIGVMGWSDITNSEVPCEPCGGIGRVPQTIAGKLDAAGIR